MFRIIFDLATEPLGLPIEWYYEWLILCVIGFIAYHIALDKVGDSYHSHMISGRMAGSFLHWVIRALCFIGLWAVTYGVIWIGKFVIANKVLVGSIAGIILLIIIAVKVVLWNRRRKELVRVKVQRKESDVEE
ncbi:MAG: hypothetical protein IKL78_05260 [Lachnospiraceae bacterium]|nr:hypothetical protein [Lachnospiraceae bacterium]